MAVWPENTSDSKMKSKVITVSILPSLCLEIGECPDTLQISLFV